MENDRTPGVRRPWIAAGWTAFALATLILLHFQMNWLNEVGNLQPGVVNLMKLGLVVTTGLVWLFWLTFFSRLPGRFLLSLLCLGLIALFFFRYKVIFDGDLGFVRIDPRLAVREFVDTQPLEHTLVDLSQTSPRDFNQFLGNRRDAEVRGRVLLPDWEADPPQLIWKQPIGAGWSGFSAVNGFAVTQEQRGQDECVSCYEMATGRLMWIHTAARRHEDVASLGKDGPRATPAIHHGRVYAQGATGVVDCLDGASGRLIWSVDLTELLKIELIEKTDRNGFQYAYEDSSLSWGRSGSPLVHEKQVIVPGGGPRGGPYNTLIALDAETGKECWRGGDSQIAYGSPAMARLLGRDQITIIAESAAIGFAPDSGQMLWKHERRGFSDSEANCSQVIAMGPNRILLTKGYALGGEMVELSQNENQIQTRTIWKNPRVLKTKMTSPVLKDGYAYSLSDGFLECSNVTDDALEGQRVWRKRGRFGNGQLLLVGDYLLVHTEYGVLKLIAASPESYQELGEIETIEGVCWNTICLSDRFLLVRSELEAACFELAMEYAANGAGSKQPPADTVHGTTDLEPDAAADHE